MICPVVYLCERLHAYDRIYKFETCEASLPSHNISCTYLRSDVIS